MVPRLRSLVQAVVLLATLSLAGSTLSVAQQVQPDTAPNLTLAEAIKRAQANEPIFASALAAQKSAGINSYLAKAALLPSVTYHNQMLYTQPNGQTNQGGQVGSQASPIFIANNSVHEYSSQAVINETIGLRQFADSQVASANAARATAELEIARRGLVSAVVNLYYTVSTAQERARLQAEAFTEAQSFTMLTQKREAAREVAHADVVKAQLQMQQKQRDLADAKVAADRVRLELGVLLFPDPRTPYATDLPATMPMLPSHEEVNQLASQHNPEMRSALADINAANAAVKSARAAYLPDLGLNFTYGIDAPQFAKRGPDGVRNLGYSLSGTLDIPVWDWFSTQKRVKQSEIQRDVAKVNLTAAQRRLIATLEESYAEAAAARDQLDLLEQSVRTADESLKLTRMRYVAGESTALEVVDAQNSYLAAQTAQADGLVRFETAAASLQLLTGSL
ncbi:TolC family protein [Edaphobacter sp. HDX4]|uniref:TolC family protein n=1 Tax=Edaphobacter sp. HDX4 TaxID=2794064 RepID=UPI002FE6835B